MSIIAILILLGSPKYKEYTEEARLTKLVVELKELEKASQKYYMSKGDWPRLSDEAYNSEDINNFSEKIYGSTGKVIELETDGSYYDIDYSKLSNYITDISNKGNYILQNPVGSVYYMKNLSLNRITIINEIYPNDKSVVVDTRPVEQVFTYTGDIQEFEVPASGKYLLEVWGAEGGKYGGLGGKGGYSTGDIELVKGKKLYIVVGGTGLKGINGGGYNGGGGSSSISGAAGGGATHIAKSGGLLSSLSLNKEDVLIVAGGSLGGNGGFGGGGYYGGGGGGQSLGASTGSSQGGGGGSSYIGGVENRHTETGVNEGPAKAFITYIGQ